MKNFLKQATAAMVLISFIAPLFHFVSRADKEDKVGPNVIYNRSFEDGWDYDNGFGTSLMYELDSYLSYSKESSSFYNYYVQISASGDKGGYLSLDLGDNSPKSGKLFFEFDIKATEGNNIGGVILTKTNGRISDTILTHIVSFDNGEIRLLGESFGGAPTDWISVAFEFDFDYSDSEYKITAYANSKKIDRIYKAGSENGISSIYFGAQENFSDKDRDGHSYCLDNIRVYYGTDQKCDLSVDDYGTAVDETIKKSISIKGASGTGGHYLSGYPSVERASNPSIGADVMIYYNRYFSEGWSLANGIEDYDQRIRDNDFEIATDYAVEINKGAPSFLNYYFRFTARNTNNGYIMMNVRNQIPKEGKSYVEFDIKAGIGETIGSAIDFITMNKVNISAVKIQDGFLYLFNQKIGELGEEWCHVSIELDFTYGESIGEPNKAKFTAYAGKDTLSASTIYEVSDTPGDRHGLMQIRIGRRLDQVTVGEWYGLDNLQVYSSSVGFATLPDDQYGTLVDINKTKDFELDSNVSTTINTSEIIKSALLMKVNSNNALFFGEKRAIFDDLDGAYGAPIKYDGIVMVPLEILLEYTNVPHLWSEDKNACDIFVNGENRSLAVGRDGVCINGKDVSLAHTPILMVNGDNSNVYIALSDVELIFDGFYVTYDDCGFIAVARYDNFLNRSTDEDYMRDLMKRYIYDTPDENNIYELALGSSGLEHPYLFANQERFDELVEIYNAMPNEDKFDQVLIEYIDDQIAEAKELLSDYANLDEYGNYIGLKEGQWKPNAQGIVKWDVSQSTGNHSVAVMPYEDTNGYDPAGGRLNVISEEGGLATIAETLAFAYQMTRDDNYLFFVYDWLIALCSWEHWGPDHYLNVSNTARQLAIAYDWCYRGFLANGLDVKPIQDGFYKHCVYTAWRSLNNLAPEYNSQKVDNGSNWWSHNGNWNHSGASGIIPSCLIAFEYEEYIEIASWVFTKTVYYLCQNAFDYFSFDGSYQESSGYWTATASLAHQCSEMLTNSVGTDFGLSLAPGLNLTNYYGVSLESSDYVNWNFHEDYIHSLPSWWYYMSGKIYDNPDYAAIRYMHIKDGKPSSRYDCLYYDKDMILSGSSSLPLDFVMEGLEGIVTRSSWDPGALYAGIMGGENSVDHGQHDSGNWIYENAGIRWFVDLGHDDYNLYAPGGINYAWGYYMYSAEGNNTVAITSLDDDLPFGQSSSKGAGGVLISSIVNEHGTATVIDQTSTYGGVSNVTYARRGMLVTNDRKTVVIQDEIVLVYAQNLYWFAHYDLTAVKSVTLSDNGRTAYMTSYPNENGKTQTLRVSLLTANRALKFEIWDAYTFTLDATPRPGFSQSMNGIDEYDRSMYNKLVIKGDSVVKFEVAVVLELLEEGEELEVGYKTGWDGNASALPPMLSWVPTADMRSQIVEETTEYRGSPSISSLLSLSDDLSLCVQEKNYLSLKRNAFFKILADIQYIVNKFGREFNDERLDECIASYEEAKESYDNYQQKVSESSRAINEIARNLIGVK